MIDNRGNKKEKTQEKSFPKVHVNWFPGHMAKALKQMEQDLKLIDVVIEILDARIPISSQNPSVNNIIKNKKKIVILNKSDLSEEAENKKWVQYFEKSNVPAILCNSNSGDGINKVEKVIEKLMQSDREKALEKGRTRKVVRAMIIGIPNVGKSSFINRISKKAATQVGNKPGVTKQTQWIRLSNNIELLDTPGVLWPKFQSDEIALNLAFTGTIKSEILPETEIAYELIKLLKKDYSQNIVDKYKISITEILKNSSLEENEKIMSVMNLIGKSRGALIKGGEIDIDKTAKIILDDFKNGKLGKITLERLEE